MNNEDIVDVLSKCAAYDPIHFPKPSEAIAAAWQEHFAQFRVLTRDDVLAAVRTYYNTPERPVPLPADISRIARTIHRDTMDADEAALEYEAVCDRKAGDRRAPRRAPLTPEQQAANREKLVGIVKSITERTPATPAPPATPEPPKEAAPALPDESKPPAATPTPPEDDSPVTDGHSA